MVINKKITVSILSIYGISLQAVCCGSLLVNIEDTLRLANRVNSHLLIGFKAMSRNDTVRLLDTDKLIRINSLCPLVPIQQLCIKLLTFQILYMHIPHQFPQLLLIKEVGCISLDTCLHLEDRVELLQIDPLSKAQ